MPVKCCCLKISFHCIFSVSSVLSSVWFLDTDHQCVLSVIVSWNNIGKRGIWRSSSLLMKAELVLQLNQVAQRLVSQVL